MRVNSINLFTNYNKNISFKHTAVPYPEYVHVYKKNDDVKDIVSKFSKKISSIFSPEVEKESGVIRSDIDSLYPKKSDMNSKKNANDRLLSVLA